MNVFADDTESASSTESMLDSNTGNQDITSSTTTVFTEGTNTSSTTSPSDKGDTSSSDTSSMVVIPYNDTNQNTSEDKKEIEEQEKPVQNQAAVISVLEEKNTEEVKSEVVVPEESIMTKEDSKIVWKPEHNPAQGVAIKIKDNRDAKIDLTTLNVSIPDGAGELELYTLSEKCSGDLKTIKKNILVFPYCGESTGFAIMRPNDYSWNIKKDERIVIGFCQSTEIDCSDNPDKFKIIFLSKEVLGLNTSVGHHELSLYQ